MTDAIKTRRRVGLLITVGMLLLFGYVVYVINTHNQEALREAAPRQPLVTFDSPTEMVAAQTKATASQTTPSGELVARAQGLLGKLGYDPGPIDGVAGHRTRTAVLAFQRFTGLPADGTITEMLVNRLSGASVVQKYATKEIQAKPVNALGLTRASIQSRFEKSEVGFRFQQSTPVDGQPRVIGKARNELAMIELIGRAENLSKVSIMVGWPSDIPEVMGENIVYIVALVGAAVPDWPGSADWIADNIVGSTTQGGVKTRYGHREISINWHQELGLIIVSVKPVH